MAEIPATNWPTVAYALAVAIPSILSYLKSRQNGKKADETNSKTDVLVKKTESIHDLTNGHHTRNLVELEAAKVRIAKLEELVDALIEKKTLAGRKKRAKVLATGGGGVREEGSG